MKASNQLIEMNLRKEIPNAIATALGIPVYLEIIGEVNSKEFNADNSFRKKFNGFYKVRQRKSDWYDDYYRLMVEQKEKRKSFGDVLTVLYKKQNTIEVSFTSKLISSIDPNKPIWDQYVIKNLGLNKEWDSVKNKSREERIKVAELIYERIETWYIEYLESEEGKEFIKEFDAILPEYKERLSSIKKLDYVLVFKR